jgi:uncharacterized coiled-coil protein SlyX
VNGVNRVKRAPRAGHVTSENRGTTGEDAPLVWTNVAALKALMGRAERELAREPGAYVAVAVVAADRREEQVARWTRAGTADAGARVADLGKRLGTGARGLRVRVHHGDGGLIGSVLLRRARRDGASVPSVVVVGDERAERRLAALEAQLAAALERIAEQDREIAGLRDEVERVEHLPTAVTNMHHRLDAVEAVCERVDEAEAGLVADDDGEDDEENGDDGEGDDDDEAE